MTRRDPAPRSNGPIRRPRRKAPSYPRPHCGEELVTKRDGDYVATTCIVCSRVMARRYSPKPKLGTEEPQLTKGLEMYCDLRRRGHTDEAILSRTGWPRHYPDLLLEEANRREMPGSAENADEAFHEWLLEMHDAGMNMTEICRLSGRSGPRTRMALSELLEAAHYAELECWTATRENYADADCGLP